MYSEAMNILRFAPAIRFWIDPKQKRNEAKQQKQCQLNPFLTSDVSTV